MNESHLDLSVSLRRYRVNAPYAAAAERAFVHTTTTTDVKRTLAVQKLSDRFCRIPPVASFLATRLRDAHRVSVPQRESSDLALSLGPCVVDASITRGEAGPDTVLIRAELEVVRGRLTDAGLGLGLELREWDPVNFICAPGAAYDGGRFERHRTLYPPFLPPERWKEDLPIITSEIPGLDVERTHSRMDLLTGEMTSPMVGIWLEREGRCIWIETKQATELGGTGFSFEEDLERGTLSVELVAPMVREHVRHHGASTLPSWDRGHDLEKGTRVALELRIHTSPCESVEDFYACFRSLGLGDRSGPALSRNELPFSAAWDLIESQYNRDRWSEEHGYYHAGFIPPFIPADAWSAGWTGGLALSYALLCRGDERSRERALRNLAFFFREDGQSAAGIFYATSDGERWGGDNYFVSDHIGDPDWIHVRRCGDYLLFVIKHFRLLRARGLSDRIEDDWLEKTRRCADALCRLWDAHGDFGQYIDPNTLEIRIGNSDAGSILPAALAECGAFFENGRYLEVAEASLGFYHRRFLKHGFTAGGPLEILCAPDCESAVNLAESLVTVYEHTRDESWLRKAHRYSDYIRTWFYTYDVRFPPGSLLDRLGVRTTGAMMASSQNRCGVPNLCTLSGDLFWRLFRYTGDEHLLELIQECVHNTHQYLSRADHPIVTMRGEALPPGTMHECIQTGDWAGPAGEIPYEYPTSWTEVAHLLSMAELPGIYLVPDLGRLFVFDHLNAELETDDPEAVVLKITNPTTFDSTTTLYVETAAQMATRPERDLLQRGLTLQVGAGRSIRHTVSKMAVVPGSGS